MAEKLSARTADKVFNKLPEGLVDLCISHYELLISFENIRRNASNTELVNRLDVMADKLKDNVDILTDLIRNLTSRDIHLHTTAEGDTLWNLSRRYKTEIHEICEINNIENVLKPYEKKYLLIPTRP